MILYRSVAALVCCFFIIVVAAIVLELGVLFLLFTLLSSHESQAIITRAATRPIL